MDPSHAQAEPDAGGPIRTDLACIYCDYNLRGLRTESCCPECGRPASDSLHGDLLRCAPRPWLRQLANGAAWIRWAPLVAVALSLLGMYSPTVLQAIGILTPFEVKRLAGLFTWVIPLVGAMLAGLIGCLRITSPEPGKEPHTQSIRTSRAARVIILAAAAVWMLATITDIVRLRVPWLLHCAAIIAWPVGYLALLTHLRELGLRVPDAKLVRDTRIAVAGAIFLNILFAIWLFFLIGCYRRHLHRILLQGPAERLSPRPGFLSKTPPS